MKKKRWTTRRLAPCLLLQLHGLELREKLVKSLSFISLSFIDGGHKAAVESVWHFAAQPELAEWPPLDDCGIE